MAKVNAAVLAILKHGVPNRVAVILEEHRSERAAQPPSHTRFELTEMGRKHVDEFLAHDEHMRSRNRNIRKMYWKLHTGMTEDLYESLGGLLDALEDAYSKHRIDISPDWFLPMMEPQHILRLRELDSSPTKKGTQAPFFCVLSGSVCQR